MTVRLTTVLARSSSAFATAVRAVFSIVLSSASSPPICSMARWMSACAAVTCARAWSSVACATSTRRTEMVPGSSLYRRSSRVASCRALSFIRSRGEQVGARRSDGGAAGADLPAGVLEIGPRLVQRDLVLRRIDLEQRLVLLDLLVVRDHRRASPCRRPAGATPTTISLDPRLRGERREAVGEQVPRQAQHDGECDADQPLLDGTAAVVAARRCARFTAASFSSFSSATFPPRMPIRHAEVPGASQGLSSTGTGSSRRSPQLVRSRIVSRMDSGIICSMDMSVQPPPMDL